MQPRSRARRIAKWTGLGLCVAIALAFAVTPWWYFFWQFGSARINVMSGSLHVIGVEVFGWELPKWGSGRNLYTPAQWTSQLTNWIIIELSSETTSFITTKTGTTLPIKVRKPSYVIVPLWMPFVLVALPTALLWWYDRRYRFPPGHCRKCGYDLTGNVSGRCSECGHPV